MVETQQLSVPTRGGMMNDQDLRVCECLLNLLEDSPKAGQMLMYFDHDVQAAKLAFRLFVESADTCEPLLLRGLIHHASCFICAVRRAGRLLESVQQFRGNLPPQLADAVKLEWKKKHSFFQAFVEPRDAIEHIDGQATDGMEVVAFSFIDGRFVVANGVSVEINQAAMDKLSSAHDAIADACVKAYGLSALCEGLGER